MIKWIKDVIDGVRRSITNWIYIHKRDRIMNSSLWIKDKINVKLFKELLNTHYNSMALSRMIQAYIFQKMPYGIHENYTENIICEVKTFGLDPETMTYPIIVWVDPKSCEINRTKLETEVLTKIQTDLNMAYKKINGKYNNYVDNEWFVVTPKYAGENYGPLNLQQKTEDKQEQDVK